MWFIVLVINCIRSHCKSSLKEEVMSHAYISQNNQVKTWYKIPVHPWYISKSLTDGKICSFASPFFFVYAHMDHDSSFFFYFITVPSDTSFVTYKA
jgi:hypothetical protein